ncbi:MAG: DegT/DnrJ/EryC1/StrS family aminotransferase [Melioribacteraceae bacterium]|jgi:dTDP-4-amino-4,6-dideoxygalactose transaminase|nr:DegT/DnrJ/EryC1/StrS family aminotransferase [Melioribacteraceae bacterium]
MNVPLLDLKAQYQSLKNELDAAILHTAETQYFILGPEVQKLEGEISEYLGANHSVGVSSGTDALLLALMALDIKAGDEVIVPTYSFFATAGVVSRLNAIPVFVDCDPVTFNIDPAQIEAKITDKTKAIIPVHLYGQSADMDPIMEIAKKHNLKVVEDGAQAISVQYKDGKSVGTIGDVGCYSFFPSKNLGCYGDGGMTVTMDRDIAELLKVKRVHGGKPKYYHGMIGGNFRLDAIQAGVLSVKLPHLDDWSQARRDNAALYTKLFVEAGLAEEEGKISLTENNKVLLPKAVYKPMQSSNHSSIQKDVSENSNIPSFQHSQNGLVNYHIYNQYVIRVENRDELLAHLRENSIGCEIYYPVSFHQQECFQDLPSSKDEYPNADFAASHSIALPIYPELAKEQIEFVVQTIEEFIK